MPRLNARWLSFFAASTAVLLTLVAVVGWASFQEGTKNKNKFSKPRVQVSSSALQLPLIKPKDAFGVDIESNDSENQFTNWTDANLALAMDLTIDSFDPSKGVNAVRSNAFAPRQANLVSAPSLGFTSITSPSIIWLPRTGHLSLLLFQVCGTHLDIFAIYIQQPRSTTATPVRNVQFRGADDHAFPDSFSNLGTPYPSIKIHFLIGEKDGDVNRYPFDVFTVDYQIFAFSSPSNLTYGTPLPITIFAQGSIQGFKIDTVFLGLSDDGSGVNISITVSRSPITKAFSVVIILGPFFFKKKPCIAADAEMQ